MSRNHNIELLYHFSTEVTRGRCEVLQDFTTQSKKLIFKVDTSTKKKNLFINYILESSI